MLRKSVLRKNLLEVFISALLKRRLPEWGETPSRYNVLATRCGRGSISKINKALCPIAHPLVGISSKAIGDLPLLNGLEGWAKLSK